MRNIRDARELTVADNTRPCCPSRYGYIAQQSNEVAKSIKRNAEANESQQGFWLLPFDLDDVKVKKKQGQTDYKLAKEFTEELEADPQCLIRACSPRLWFGPPVCDVIRV